MNLTNGMACEPASGKEHRRRFTNEWTTSGAEAVLTIARKDSGEVSLVCRVDLDDVPLLGRFYWTPQGGYAAASCAGSRSVVMHWMLVGVWYDHRNRDRADNRRCNLRPATFRQNQRNRGPLAGKEVPYKGVSFFKHNQKYVARIGVDNGSKYLGCFADAESAARAYDAAAREHHGEFAACNFN